MVRFVPVAGTYGWQPGELKGQWYQPDSVWSQFMRAHGFESVECDSRPFTWSTEIDGVWPWRRHATWTAAGWNLYAFIVPPLAPDRRIPPARTFVVSYSHALQPVLYACALGLKINMLIDIGGPVRADMMAIAEQAKANIQHWLHIYSDDSDVWQWLGTIGDRVLGIVRPHPLARNEYVPRVGHGGLLHEPQWFPLWHPWLETMRARDGTL